MAASLVGYVLDSNHETNTSTTLDFTIPTSGGTAIADGDWLYVWHTHAGSSSNGLLTLPEGWELISRTTAGTNCIHIHRHKWVTGDPTTLSFTMATALVPQSVAFWVRGAADTGHVWGGWSFRNDEVTAGTITTFQSIAKSVTTVSDDNLVIALLNERTTATTGETSPPTMSGTTVSQVLYQPQNGSVNTLYVGQFTKSTAGATGNVIATYPNSQTANGTGAQIAFPPAPESDTTAPTVPTGVNITSLTTTSATVNWTASTDANGVTAYRVYLNGTLNDTVSSPTVSKNLTGLTQGTTYTVTVSAGDGAGNWSAQTSGVEFTTLTPSSPVLKYAWVGDPRTDGFTVACRATDADSLRLAVSTDSGLASPTYTSAIAPDSDGYAKLRVTGLTQNTRYYWAVEVDGTLTTSMSGQARTMPSATKASFKFASSSCHDYNLSSSFGWMKTRALNDDWLFFVHLGDLGYPYITASGVPIAPDNIATLRTDRQIYLEAETCMNFYRNVVTQYTYSDGDGAGTNSDGTWAAFVSGAVQSAYRQQTPLPQTMPLSTSQARSWVVGRVRFILTDERTMASARGATDDSSKSKLGTAQKAWFKAEIDAAVTAGQVVVWLGDGPWAGTPQTPSGTIDVWRVYNTERVELGNYISTSGVKLIRIHGDTHTLAADSGVNNPYGGFPFISAAPFSTTANAWGGLSSLTHGSYPATTTNSQRQYGEYSVTDNGTSLSLNFSGKNYDNNTSAYVERVSMLTTWTMPDVEEPGGDPGTTFEVTIRLNGQVVSIYHSGQQVAFVPAT